MITRVLSQNHVIAGSAGDGRQLVAAKAHRPDVVVSDVSMPSLTGLEAMKYLRNDRLNLSFRSGEHKLCRIEAYIEAGAMTFVSK